MFMIYLLKKTWVSLPVLAKGFYKTIKVYIITYQSAGIKCDLIMVFVAMFQGCINKGRSSIIDKLSGKGL